MYCSLGHDYREEEQDAKEAPNVNYLLIGRARREISDLKHSEISSKILFLVLKNPSCSIPSKLLEDRYIKKLLIASNI